jgi:hypothetical protein
LRREWREEEGEAEEVSSSKEIGAGKRKVAVVVGGRLVSLVVQVHQFAGSSRRGGKVNTDNTSIISFQLYYTEHLQCRKSRALVISPNKVA